jgi:hypothetical protein
MLLNWISQFTWDKKSSIGFEFELRRYQKYLAKNSLLWLRNAACICQAVQVLKIDKNLIFSKPIDIVYLIWNYSLIAALPTIVLTTSISKLI